MSNNWRYGIVDPENSSKIKEPSMNFLAAALQNAVTAYPFQIVNWIAVIVHLATCIAMIIIYAGLDEPVEYPYTETYITWKRLMIHQKI